MLNNLAVWIVDNYRNLKTGLMVWDKNNYPDSMKNLDEDVREKAIEIANAMMRENKSMNEGQIIAIAMKKAKEAVKK